GLTGSRCDIIAASLVARGVALMYEGNTNEAKRSLEAVGDEAHGVWRASGLGSLALAEAWSGRFTAGRQWAGRALALGEDLGLGDAALTTARLALALVARERDDLDGAAEWLDEVAHQAGADRRRVLESWVAIEQAHLALAAGQPAAGPAALARHPAAEHPSMPRAIFGRRCAVEAHLLMMLGDHAGAAQGVGRAEDVPAAAVTSARGRLAVE